MSPPVLLALAIVFSYLVGSIPFGLLIARYGYGVDLRKQGSGNIGATNVGRVLGRKCGIACLVLDFMKGLAPTLLPLAMPFPDAWIRPTQVACGAAAIAGHVFPIWLGLRGGKGVATGAGVAVVLSWPAALAAAIVFGAVFATKRVVSLASIAAAAVYAVAAIIWLGDPLAKSNLPMTLFAVAIPSLIVWRHRDNIRRLLQGEERPFSTPTGGAHDHPPVTTTEA